MQKVAIVVLSAIFFISSFEALHLDCNYITDDIWTVNNVFICEARVNLIGGDFQTVTSVSQNLPIGRTLADVRGISIVNQTQRSFPRNISNFFPNIEVIRLQNIGLREIIREDIQGFPALRQISLSGNEIRYIRKDFFASYPRLEAIDFDFNPVMHIAHSAFEGLFHLRSLRLVNTTCMNQQVDNSEYFARRMLFDLFRNCPPTTWMIAEDMGFAALKNEVHGLATTVNEHVDVVNGEMSVFEKRLEEQIEIIGALEGIVSDHESRISELEHPEGSGYDALIPLI